MTVKEQLTEAVSTLSDEEAAVVARFVHLLRLRSAVSRRRDFDEQAIAALYSDAAEDDRSLADAGLDEYELGLAAEDA